MGTRLQQNIIVALALGVAILFLQMKCQRDQFNAERAEWVGTIQSFKPLIDGSARASKEMVAAYGGMEGRLDKIGGEITKVVKSNREQLRKIGKIEATLEAVVGGGEAEVTDEAAEYSDTMVWIKYWFEQARFEYELKPHQLEINVVETKESRYVEINDVTLGKKIRVDNANWVEYDPGQSFWSKLNLGIGAHIEDEVDIVGAAVYGRYAVLVTKTLVAQSEPEGWRLDTDWKSGLGAGLLIFLK